MWSEGLENHGGGGHDSREVLGSEIPTKGQQARHLAWAIPAYLLPPATLTYAPPVAGGQSLQPKVLSSESPFPKLFQIIRHVTTLPGPAPTVHYSKQPLCESNPSGVPKAFPHLSGTGHAIPNPV